MMGLIYTLTTQIKNTKPPLKKQAKPKPTDPNNPMERE
ncbi:hypothetical protein BN341_18800 [Helicobacter heilmannii ASB1.4]|uniref:Uncharacterized protein n=1 Tax=Helicobacter heilmannii TaxID=35817 RepID=A0A0K2Y9R3_HELHE|nr:hypothetical protein BN341_18800 [Helicobacter heilmannii ASB1.4]CRI33725.1 hypothetical protein HHE01_14110 [Helicobacter heilmannii]